MAFTVATYNVLASAYIKPQWYPNTPNELLRPEHRIPALSQYARQLDADILCLQEVEDTTFGNLGAALAGCGYRGALKKGRSEEHTSELQSHSDLVCRLLLEKKKQTK